MTPGSSGNNPCWSFLRLFCLFNRIILIVNVAWAAEVPCPEQSLSDCRLLILSVWINGSQPRETGQREIFVFRKAHQIFVTRNTLEQWQLIVPQEASFILRDNMEWVALDECPGVAFTLREDTQELVIEASPHSFHHVLSRYGQPAVTRSPIERGTGLFLNYDLNFDRMDKTNFSGFFDLNAYGKWGLLNHRFLRRGFGDNALIRLETSLIHDLPDRMQTIQFGDAQTTPGSWGRSVYFGGVQWRTNFSTQPDLILFPLPSIRGEAIAPSTAELYINNVLRWTQPVSPGPFEIQNPPLVSGPGQATLVVQDMLGRQVVTTQSYFSTPLLLRPGLTEFSLSAGKIRTAMGTPQDRYGRSFFSGFYRRGLNNRLTTELRNETAGSLFVNGITMTAILAGPLIGKAGVVQSTGNQLQGQMFIGGLEIQTRRFTAGLHTDRSTSGFRQLGLDMYRLPPRKQDRAFFGFSLFRRDNLTFSYFRQDGDVRLSHFTAAFSLTLNQRLFWTTSLSNTLTGSRQKSLMTGLVYHIGNRTSVMPSVRHTGGRTDPQVQIQKNRTFGPGIGYRIFGTTGEQSRVSAEVSAGNRHQDFQFAIAEGKTGTYYRAGMQGAIILTPQKALITRRIDDSFAIVKVGNYPGIRVYADHQSIGVTDKKGVVIVPRMLSYQENRISFDPDNLPLDASLERIETRIRPARRNGVLVDFQVTQSHSALIRFQTEAGSPLPRGAQGEVLFTHESFFIGKDGLGYLTTLERGKQSQIKISLPDGEYCVTEITLGNAGNQEDIQTVICSVQ